VWCNKIQPLQLLECVNKATVVTQTRVWSDEEKKNSLKRRPAIFWNVTPCAPVEVHWHFGEKYCLHLRGQRVSQARKLREARVNQTERRYVTTSLSFYWAARRRIPDHRSLHNHYCQDMKSNEIFNLDADNFALGKTVYYLDGSETTVAARSEAWTVFARSNTGIVCSNPTLGMNVRVRLFCVCVVTCKQRPCEGLITRQRSLTDCV
jgi:hypothetical protein